MMILQMSLEKERGGMWSVFSSLSVSVSVSVSVSEEEEEEEEAAVVVVMERQEVGEEEEEGVLCLPGCERHLELIPLVGSWRAGTI